MSKIICDVCGTSYPDTADQCPICGCVRSVESAPFMDDAGERAEHRNGTYIYTKGGRFSKANVGKRNRSAGTIVDNTESVNGSSEEIVRKDKGLIIAIVALLVAIVGVVAFIAVRYLLPEMPEDMAIDTSTAQTTEATTLSTTVPATEAETTVPTVPLVPCEEISVSNSVIEFDTAGQSVLLSISFTPVETNEQLLLSSSDEAVAMVSDGGVVTAIGRGEAVITISCGEATAECRVVCTFDGTVEPTAGATEPTEVSTEPENTEYDPSQLKLNWRYTMVENPEIGDVTMSRGTTWQAYVESSGKIPASVIKFTSSNTSVATIDDTGLVTAVGSGQTYIKAEYGSKVVECRIICP